MTNRPAISILIRTFNSARTLEKVLGKLDLIDGDELVIVDSGSTDSTLEIATARQATILRLPPPFNYSKSLNAGFEAASCDWVLVISSHCIPLRDDILARLGEIAVNSEEDIGAIYGRISLFPRDPGEPAVETGDHAAWKSYRFPGGGNGLALYPKRFWQLHRFDEDLVTAEDMDWLVWCLSSGFRASFVPDAVVLYRNQGSISHMFRKGWHEALLGMRMRNNETGPRTALQAMRSFTVSSLYLTKHLLGGRFGISDYLRMVSHGLGAAMASTALGNKDREQA